MIKFENPTNGRYYYLKVARDGFNELVLTIIRGGCRPPVIRHIGFNCELAIHDEIARLSKRRISRGYVLIQY